MAFIFVPMILLIFSVFKIKGDENWPSEFIIDKKWLDLFCGLYNEYFITPKYWLFWNWWTQSTINSLNIVKNILIFGYDLNESKKSTFELQHLQQYDIPTW